MPRFPTIARTTVAGTLSCLVAAIVCVGGAPHVARAEEPIIAPAVRDHLLKQDAAAPATTPVTVPAAADTSVIARKIKLDPTAASLLQIARDGLVAYKSQPASPGDERVMLHVMPTTQGGAALYLVASF